MRAERLEVLDFPSRTPRKQGILSMAIAALAPSKRDI
jgi:hypothetical protein